MKRVNKEITGKDRIQRELKANGRKKIQKETAGIIENKEIMAKENEPQKNAESENKEKMQSGQNTGSGKEEATDENADTPDMFSENINAIDMENLAESAETGSQVQKANAENQKPDIFSGCRIQRKDTEKLRPAAFSGRQTQMQNVQRILADKQEERQAKAPNAETDSLQAGVISDMEAILKEGKEEELRDLIEWFLEENIRMEMLQKEICEKQAQLENEKNQFTEYVKSKEYSIEMDQKRLEKENRFFDQKMQILQGGFKQLEEDRRNFQKEQDKFNASKEAYAETQDAFKRYETTEMLFRGVNSFLALKKRYKDLIKVFHPDNVAGDHEMVQLINREYEELKKAYEVGMQA